MSEKERVGRRRRSEEQEDGTTKRRTYWTGRLLWLAGLVILVGGAVIYAVPVLDRLDDQHVEVAQAREELDSLVAANAELEERLDALNSPIEIERLARERLGYAREGETAFVVVSSRLDDPDAAEIAAGEQVDAVEGEPWYERWWNYLSGSDLTSDS